MRTPLPLTASTLCTNLHEALGFDIEQSSPGPYDALNIVNANFTAADQIVYLLIRRSCSKRMARNLHFTAFGTDYLVRTSLH
jgi:hypothetical protein